MFPQWPTALSSCRGLPRAPACVLRSANVYGASRAGLGPPHTAFVLVGDSSTHIKVVETHLTFPMMENKAGRGTGAAWGSQGRSHRGGVCTKTHRGRGRGSGRDWGRGVAGATALRGQGWRTVAQDSATAGAAGQLGTGQPACRQPWLRDGPAGGSELRSVWARAENRLERRVRAGAGAGRDGGGGGEKSPVTGRASVCALRVGQPHLRWRPAEAG